MSAVIEIASIQRPRHAARTDGRSAYARPVRRIDVRDDYQVRHMCRLYGVSPLAVCRAVDQVGDDMAAVQDYLRTR
jgi:Protein of unknown function (DUF3606)